MDTECISRIVQIPNGERWVNFAFYNCGACSEEIRMCDCWSIVEGIKYHPDCAFKKGLITEKECKDVGYYYICQDFYLIIENSEVIAVLGKRTDKAKRDRRTSPEYARWRTSVFSRDDFTCLECATKGGELNAHHILSYSKYKDKRLEIANGKTLCVECHKKEHRGCR